MEGLGFLTALVVSFVTGRVAIAVGGRAGLVDLPDSELKHHEGAPVPLGGTAVLLGAHAGLAVSGVFDVGLLAASVLVWVVGLIDDLKGLSPVTRLVGATAGGIVLVGMSRESFEVGIAIFWVVAVVVVVNAVNLFDGLDALAGSVSTVAVFGIIWFGAIQDVPEPWVLVAIAGSLLGFLYWNRPRARLFLGDNGAYVVGVLLVWAAIWSSPDRLSGVVAVGLVGVPLIDLAVTVVRRGLSGSPFFEGDRDHTYDRLHSEGFTPLGVALIHSLSQVVWVALIVGASLLWGDLAAAITALGLGLGLAALFGALMTIDHR